MLHEGLDWKEGSISWLSMPLAEAQGCLLLQSYHVVLCLHLKRSSSSFIQLWGFFFGLLSSVCAVNVSVPRAGRL